MRSFVAVAALALVALALQGCGGCDTDEAKKECVDKYENTCKGINTLIDCINNQSCCDDVDTSTLSKALKTSGTCTGDDEIKSCGD